MSGSEVVGYTAGKESLGAKPSRDQRRDDLRFRAMPYVGTAPILPGEVVCPSWFLLPFAGACLIVLRVILGAFYDPNGEDVEHRIQVGQALAILREEMELKVDLLRLLENRFGRLPADVEARVYDTKDLAKLNRWLGDAAAVVSLDEFRQRTES